MFYRATLTIKAARVELELIRGSNHENYWRVAAVSMNGFPGRTRSASRGHRRLVRARAAAEAPSWCCFPSWSFTAIARRTPGTLAEPVPDGPSVRAPDARSPGAIAWSSCAGMSEKERDIVYNTQVLVGPDGFIGKQRKLHLSRDEVVLLQGRPGHHRSSTSARARSASSSVTTTSFPRSRACWPCAAPR